jgi:subtilisin family serine protease
MIQEYLVIKDILNIRSGPSEQSDFVSQLLKGETVWLDDKEITGTIPKDGITNIWLVYNSNNFVSKDGIKQIFKWFDDLKIASIWNAYKEKGDSVTIAVLDTGYDRANNDIEQAIDKEAVIIDKEKYDATQLIIDDRSIIGHGTRCASLIASRNELLSIIGIAPECKLLVGKISINREIRKFEYILNGIKWAIDQGADIISISYAVSLTDGEIDDYNEKFQNVINNKSVLIFSAAGNSDGTIMKGERYPASFENCISIGSTDVNNNIANFTILSSKTILHTIGMDVESYGKNTTPGPQSGTSYSTPIIAAIAGLAISYLKKRSTAFNKVDVINKLINTGDNIRGEQNKKTINILRLFKSLETNSI